MLNYSVLVQKREVIIFVFKDALITSRDKLRKEMTPAYRKRFSKICQEVIDRLSKDNLRSSSANECIVDAYVFIMEQDTSVKETIFEEMPRELEYVLDNKFIV